MLSLECQTVYDLIRQIAGEEEVYKIIEADEIIERLPRVASFKGAIVGNNPRA